MNNGITFGVLKSLIFPAFLLLAFFSKSSDVIPIPVSWASESEINEIESKLLREKKKLRAFDIKEKDILIHLADLEHEVEKKREAIDELKKRIVLAKSDLERLGNKLDSLGRSLEAAEIQLAKRLVALYKYARRGYVKMVATSGNLDQLWHRLKYIKAIVSEGRKELVRLADQAVEHEKEIILVQERIAKTEAMKNKESERLSSLKKDLDKKVVYLVKIHIEREFYETIVNELQIAARNLKQTMQDIENKKTYTLSRPSNFADSKGRLPLPLEGQIFRSDKRLGFENMNLQKGVFIEGSSNGKVRAVFSGRVDFSGKLKGYGEVIIVNHGSRFFTISANLWQRKKNEGDVVEAGEVIGLAGHIGSSKETRLYFEIRRAGKEVDPLKWLKIN
jgi:septal ring factor EnvC (AmiA/AmiB activator)